MLTAGARDRVNELDYQLDTVARTHIEDTMAGLDASIYHGRYQSLRADRRDTRALLVDMLSIKAQERGGGDDLDLGGVPGL